MSKSIYSGSLQHRVEEQRLASIIKGTNVGTWEWNVQTGEAVFNERWAEIIGYTLEELAPISIDTWMRHAHHEDLSASSALLEAHFKGESDYYEFECRIKHKDGRWVWVLDRGCVADWTDDGKPLMMFGTHQDITDRRRVEEALRESEANFRTFFESTTDIILVGTPQGQIVFANGATSQKLGYSADELNSLHILDLHPADRRREAEDIFGAMFRGDRDICQLPLAAKDGSIVPVETRVWFGQWSGVDCVFGICKDLSAENEARQLFERLFRNNPALMALSTLDRSFSDVNDAFLDATGYARDEVIGKTAFELGLVQQASEHEAQADKLQAQGRMKNVELRIRCKDGTMLDGLFSGDLVNSQGKQHFLTVMVDITEGKRAQASLAKAAERDHHIADVLQQKLVPRNIPAQPAGFEIATRYQPALREAEVCGDFYDLFDTGDDKIAVVIGDIVGKGLYAAVGIAAVRHTIRSYALTDDRRSSVITMANRALYRDIESENDMLTVFFAELNTRTGELIYTNAGHEPPLVRHLDGSVEYLQIGGPMICGLGAHLYSEGNSVLCAGDVMVMVTDGITEARKSHGSELFGPEGILHCLSRNAGASADEIASSILADASLFAEGAVRDDVAVVVIRKLDNS